MSMTKFLLWCILLVICWPLALIALLAYPFVFLFLLPFRFLGAALKAILELAVSLLRMPARVINRI